MSHTVTVNHSTLDWLHLHSISCNMSACKWSHCSFVSSEHKLCNGECGKTMITAFLDTTVILPCSFDNSTRGPVLWSVESTSTTSYLVQINNSKQVSFKEHKTGRVVVFPNLSEIGNFSIRIDRFKSDDVGTYCCVREEDKCTKVEVKEAGKARRYSSVIWTLRNAQPVDIYDADN